MMFEPREYQLSLLKAMDGGCRRAICVWHRRAGKDITGLDIVFRSAMRRAGIYYYCFPEYTQGRKILWDGKDKDGNKLLDYIPSALKAKKNETEMKLTLSNGSLIQVVGIDRVDSIVGTNPLGIVFSEYALQNPIGWDYMRPVLAENDGWALFLTTPRGENHAYSLYNFALKDKSWFAQMLTVDDTKAIKADVLEQERREIEYKYGNDAIFRQEYYCDWTTPIAGAYYAKEISDAYADGRIGRVICDKQYPVITAWDLGIDDAMAVWFLQAIGQELHFIEYKEWRNLGLADIIPEIKKRDYVYSRHIAPHDIKARELTSGKSRWETAQRLGITYDIAPNLPIIEGIEAVRAIFPRLLVDSEKCKEGLNALKNYRQLYDDKKKGFAGAPYHDWASHAADALRMAAISIMPSGKKISKADSDYHRKEKHSNFRPETV
jgi:hypothetical protein